MNSMQKSIIETTMMTSNHLTIVSQSSVMGDGASGALERLGGARLSGSEGIGFRVQNFNCIIQHSRQSCSRPLESGLLGIV